MTGRGERGSASVELVLLTPVMVLFMVLAASLGRDADTSSVARLAADHGARSASMVRLSAMETVARAAVHDVIAAHRGPCADARVAVEVVGASPLRQVAVEVSCSTGRGRIEVRSVEAVDRYRGES
jgi:hypothetical protein